MSNALITLATNFARKSPQRAEADVHAAIASFLTLAPLGLGENHVAKLEEQTGDGTRRRIDIAFGRLIIEVKRDLAVKNALTNAEPQLQAYMTVRNEESGDDYAGIITDGVDWFLYALVGNSLQRITQHTVKRVDDDAVERLRLWLDAILLTGPKLKATQPRIVERLGSQSPRYQLDRTRLAALYSRHGKTPEVALKRELWARLLRTALGTNFSDDGGLFIDHTMLVVEAEIIAHLVVGLDLTDVGPAAILSGELFHDAGIVNVVEADFFDWPAEVDGGSEIVADMVRELSQFDWTDVEHDVLKALYEAIISPEVRKNLGEYYTPDWLAHRIVTDTVTDALSQRVLDAACGSGTFVFHAIRRFLAAADAAGLPNREALEKLQDRVFGMDIHPVSAVLARVTYLLAIGTHRLADRGPLTIPIYLGDSVQWGRGSSAAFSDTVQIAVDAEDLAAVDTESYDALFAEGQHLEFPLRTIDAPASLDLLISDLTDLAKTHTVPGAKLPSIRNILSKHEVTEARDINTLRATFAVLCELNAVGRDHIWGYYVRNQIRPLWLSLPARRVDVLVGNPPWVAYRYMTAAMQKQFKIMSTTRNLWHGGKVATHQDLVGLFIARTVEQFLRDGGKFAFVTPYAVLSRMQYEGFRAGRWLDTGDQKTFAEFGESWDLADVRPPLFPVPSAVVFGVKAEAAAPMPTTVRAFEGTVSRLTSHADTIVQLSIDDVPASPYAQRAIQGATIVPRMVFMVNEVPAGPLGRPAGTTDVISARSTQEKAPWKALPSIHGQVEAEFVRTVLLSASIVPHRIVWPAHAVLPIHNDAILSPNKMAKYPLLTKRWEQMSAVWMANRTDGSKLDLAERLNFQGTMKRQLPGSAHRVVYAASGNRIAAAYVSDSEAVIEHKLYWLPVNGEREGLYLTAILNSDIVMDRVSKLQSRGLFGARDIDTLPWRLPIPLFDADNALHSTLADLGERATSAAASADLSQVTEFTAGRAAIRGLLATEGINEAINDAVLTLLGPTLAPTAARAPVLI